MAIIKVFLDFLRKRKTCWFAPMAVFPILLGIGAVHQEFVTGTKRYVRPSLPGGLVKRIPAHLE